MGWRMSMLPTTQFCGAAGRLAAGRGAGRAAAMSTHFHAKCAGDDTPEKAWHVQATFARLTDRERDEVRTWQTPSDVVIDGGEVVLRHSESERELELGLDWLGEYTDDQEAAITWGHMDFGWTVQRGVTLVAYVADVKKSRWSASGPDSLQLHAYARAYAKKRGATHYVTGLWIATDGEWLWSTEEIAVDGPVAGDLWDRIYHAATNDTGEFSTGDHCDGCWQRLHCSAHCLPAALVDTWLAPVAEGQVPDAAQATEMLVRLQRAEKVFEKARENIAQWVKRGELRIETEKKVWAACETKGSLSLDRKAVARDLPRPLDEYMSRGPSYFQMRWVNR